VIARVMTRKARAIATMFDVPSTQEKVVA